MGIAHREVQLVALRLGLEAHADQVQLFLETGRDTDHHVVHELTHRAAHGIGFTGIICWRKSQLAVFALDDDMSVLCQRQGT